MALGIIRRFSQSVVPRQKDALRADGSALAEGLLLVVVVVDSADVLELVKVALKDSIKLDTR